MEQIENMDHGYSALLSFLLLSSLVTSCGCEDKKEKERQELAAEEKTLTETLKKHFKEEAWPRIEGDIKEIRNKVKDIEEAIVDSENMLKKVNKWLRGEDTEVNMGEKLGNLAGSLKDVTEEMSDNEVLVKMKPVVEDTLKLLKNLKRQAELKGSTPKGKNTGTATPKSKK
ncbi:MAG: hypothetical protein ACYC2U_06850 [Candidatus Amoebophilus sp.]